MTTTTTTHVASGEAVAAVHATRADWLEARRNHITATDAPAILGLSPWASPFALYARKLGLIEDAAESEAMYWGSKQEPLIAERYHEETGRELLAPPPYTLYTHRERTWQATSLDRIIIADPSTGHSGPGLLEIKTTSAFRGDDWDDGPPRHYLVQLQHELAVLGYDWGGFAVLIGGQKFLWCDVLRDDDLIAGLLTAEAEFYARLQAQDPPPVDGSDAAKAALTALYQHERPGTVVALPPEADRWDAIRQAAAQEIERQMGLKQEADNALKALIGTAEVGTLPCGVSYSWKTVEKKAYQVPASSTRVLRRKGGSA